MSAGNNAADNDAAHVHAVSHKLKRAILPSLDFPTVPRHPCRMSRDFVNSLCATLPGADLSDPWGGGHDAWKVGGKMFASMGSADAGVCVKTSDPEFAAMLIETGAARKAPYFHASWVLIGWDADREFIQDRVITSYDLIRSKLTKKARDALPPRQDIPR